MIFEKRDPSKPRKFTSWVAFKMFFGALLLLVTLPIWFIPFWLMARSTSD